jgi:plastocyanin
MKVQFEWIVALLIVSLLIVGASGCAKTIGQQKDSMNIVDIKDFSFQPAEITINIGENVTWINKDPYPTVHTVTSDDNLFSFKMIEGQNATKTFDTAGKYNYHCAIHPSMKGTVIVKE